jgi:signal peptidase I
MQPALKNGDVVLVNRVIYNAVKPDRGEVIVFKPQGNENVHYYVKRVVGLPGETVEIKENSIYIDGKKLEEDYVTTEITDAGLAAQAVTLADDEYFVLGDDRKNSEDSRHADIGIVKRRYIYGKAWFIKAGDNIGFVKG